jgi:hypothetical protein
MNIDVDIDEEKDEKNRSQEIVQEEIDENR